MKFDFFKKPKLKNTQAVSVGEFYDNYFLEFEKVYGNVIQAFRTNNLENLLNYQFESAGFKNGDKLLDAGCGVCGPAIHFANNFEVEIDAISISKKQIKQAETDIKSAEVQTKVKPVLGDYHELINLFETEKYDGVYFLESFGHSTEKKALLNQVWQVLKPGGICYIKDLFLKEAVLPEHQEKIDYEVSRINEAYKYQVADLYEILKIVRKMGFIVNFVKTIDLDINDFENLAISNEFQELTGIAKIDDWETYIFPVDFFEIKITKPINDLSDGLNKYFLQNLYYLQSKNNKN